MKYTIERVENGYMVTGTHPNLDKDAIWVTEHDYDEGDAKALCGALQQIVENLRPISKHNAENVYVEVRKGSAHEN